MKIVDEISVWGQFLFKTRIWIFRVAMFMVIWPIQNWMGTLINKGTSDSSYLWLKTLKSVFCFKGFPKKACQGCHISELAQLKNTRCTSFWSILDPLLIGTVAIHWNKSDPKKQLWPITLASSCSGSALEVARFVKIRNRESRFILPEELWIRKSEPESRFLGIVNVPPLVGVDDEVTDTLLANCGDTSLVGPRCVSLYLGVTDNLQPRKSWAWIKWSTTWDVSAESENGWISYFAEMYKCFVIPQYR